MSGGRDYTAREVADILAWSLEGLKAREIAERLGRSVGAINQQISRARVKARKRRFPPKTFKAGELAAWVRKLSLPGVPDSDVAAILGTSRITVTRCRNRLGIPRRYFGGGRYKRVHPLKDGETITPAQRKARILRYLARHPEMQRLDIAAACGCGEANYHAVVRDLGLSALFRARSEEYERECG